MRPHGKRKIATLLVLVAALVGVSALLAACGGDDSGKSGDEKATTTETTAATGAAEHFQEALDALEKGDLTGPEGVNKHLNEAISLSGDLPQAKTFAEEAKEALEKGDLDKAKEEIEEGLTAAKQEPTTGEPSATVVVSTGEWFMKPDPASVKAGAIKFDVTNDGKIEHEFVVMKTDLAPGKLPVKDNKAEESAGEVEGEIERIAPGKTSELVLNLKAAKYVLLCNLTGHYKSGQYSGFTVK